MNAFNDQTPSLAGEYASIDGKPRSRCCCCYRKTLQAMICFTSGLVVAGIAFAIIISLKGGLNQKEDPGELETPGLVTSFSTTPITGSSCDIRWHKDETSNNHYILLYQLWMVAPKDFDTADSPSAFEIYTRIHLDDPLASSYRIEGLRSSQTYKFRIRACSEMGCGDYQYTRCDTLPTSIPEAPDAPEITDVKLTTSRLTSGKADFTLNFTSNVDTGGSELTNVTLQYSQYNTKLKRYSNVGKTVCDMANQCNHGCSCNVSLPIPTTATTYAFSAQSANQAGSSDWGPALYCIIFPQGQMPLCAVEVPPAPPSELKYWPAIYTNTTTNQTAINVTYTWTPGIRINAGTVTHYQIRQTDVWTQQQQPVLVGTTTSSPYTNLSLLPDSSYLVNVRAVAESGQVGEDATVVIKTPSIGSCGKEDDIKELRDHFKQIDKITNNCYVQCHQDSNPEDCTTRCIKYKIGFDAGCSLCTYERIVCYGECQCRSHYNDTCRACFESHCIPEFQKCSGLPDYAIPGFPEHFPPINGSRRS